MINNLKKAKENKRDEFYTQLKDIEKELVHYNDFFKDKVVYCNCDDPKESNFFHYFCYKFSFLGLKKLIATCYSKDGSGSTYIEYTGTRNKNDIPDDDEVVIKNLKGDGDFRSEESISFLKEADIVVTNPPFSLFREYVNQLIEYKKDFIIVGHQNAISYKEIFKFIKENKIWLGYGFKGGAAHFINKYYKNYTSVSNKTDDLIRVSGVVWFTNIKKCRYKQDIVLYKNYDPEYYPKYENYDAINIDKTKEIPMDYNGYMGVPITFLDKHNPDQFDVIALGIVGSIDFNSNKRMEILDKHGNPTGKFTYNAKGTLYRKHNAAKDSAPAFKDAESNELYQSIYARIIIKNKRIGVVN